MDSEKLYGDPDDQQGRLTAYLSGFVDGEGTFSVTVTRRRDLPLGWQLAPEFRVSQNPERAHVLELLKTTLQCGSIRANDAHRQSDRTLVFVVRRRADLINRVIPFFQRNPLLSEKQKDFERFTEIVLAMEAREHGTRAGLRRLAMVASSMNGGGRRRKNDLGGDWLTEPSETVRRTPHQG